MPEIMPFGKYKGLSVEQIALKDYGYFAYVLREIPLKKPSLRIRFEHVEKVANNFISENLCVRCINPARYISILEYPDERTSTLPFVYCSRTCYETDSNAQSQKANLMHLRFRSALSATKMDTNKLVEIVAQCMGIREGRRTKEYLHDFFDSRNLWRDDILSASSR